MESSQRGCRPPILIDELFDDPSFVRPLCEAHAPYLPVQRYATNADEAGIIGDENTVRRGELFVAPNFRGDWAYDTVTAAGAERFLHNEKLADAARTMFDAEVVIPQIVYSNFTWQLPFNQGGGHIDIPAFRGFDRTEYPIWLLTVMGHSGLFASHQIAIATAVCWFYEGADGGLDYWPNGAASEMLVHEGSIDNTAIMGDNDNMFHRVRPVGDRRDGLIEGLTLDSELRAMGDGEWAIWEKGDELARFGWPQLRLSVSWKAKVFPTVADAQRAVDHSDDLSLAEVTARFVADLAGRGITIDTPEDPLRDRDWIQTLGATYISEPAHL